ncbi:tetratricopeptide repeat protein [Gemmatimonas sp.]|uniref:tetratricopeptide repeat protein n=1 Tax=Gemmatimonas sp. TaxID=1962908 RepID=UPI0039830F88
MSTAARIDELRKKFEENPRRYFAPLANELRKAGNLSEAIALCREFLPKQPEHMSGYIVFGQALYESGDLSQARIVFEQALALDPENLKALRHLGDIAKWEGDSAGARRWYERVLEADPRNDDIAAQLMTLVTPVYVMPVVFEPEPEAPTPSAFFVPPTLSLPTAAPSFTPAFSVAPIGLGAIPTPDAALRAVDFDEINARLREPDAPPPEHVDAPMPSVDASEVREPDLLDLDAIEAAGIEAHHEMAASAVEAAVAPERAATAITDARVAETLVSAEAEQETVNAGEDDPFGFTAAATDEVPFEEGLIAPDWPDTSELVARMATPRSMTPAVVAAITPDAVAAFGSEPGDPLPTPAFDEDALFADIDAPFTPSDAPPSEMAVTREAEDVVVVADAEVDDPAAADEEAFDEIDEAEPEWIVAAAPVSTSAVEGELPWLAAAPEPERDVEPVAGAEVEPADEAGYADEASAAIDADPETAPREASFADVMPEEYNPAFVTETMGELLVSQGFTARAVSVYEELVRRRPYDPVLSSRRAELQEQLAAELAPVAPAFPTPAVTTPRFATPGYASPSVVTPAMGAAAFVARVTPPFATPVSFTPMSLTPISSPVFEASADAEPPLERVTARERFAQLASRRVPRRTPPRASVALETPADGLASLFGGNAPMHDDLAARALADAFAPIDESTHFGGELPFEEAMLGGAPRALTPMRAATPIATSAVTDATVGPFSFDRFFPDPATSEPPHHAPLPSPTPAANPARDGATPTVSDDLAQFSAWLKGLGNT